jgi:flagellar biosynthetic protein FlhB
MAEGGGQDKTEPASETAAQESPRERRHSPFARSRDLCRPDDRGRRPVDDGRRPGRQAVHDACSNGLSLEQASRSTTRIVLFERIGADIVGVMLAGLPLAGAIMLMMLASPLAIGGWNFSAKAFMPKFGKLNPINGIGNMISKNALGRAAQGGRQDPAGRRGGLGRRHGARRMH